MQDAYQEQAACTRSLQLAEAAIKMHRVEGSGAELELDPQLDEKKRDAMLSELDKRRIKAQEANAILEDACKTERNLREQLKDKEAAFAQDQILDYIAEAQYARNPMSMANAIAGLPEMAWPQSYTRCSKLNCSGWPNIWYSEFEFIEDVWSKRLSSS